MLRFAAAFVVLSAAAVAADAPRLDFAHPVEGETMRISVEKARPNSSVGVALLDENDRITQLFPLTADGAGSAHIDWPVLAGVAGGGFSIVGSNDEQTIEPVRGRFQLPQLLVTGSSADGAFLRRIPVDATANTFDQSLPPIGLGSRIVPGGAVRDARGTKTYVVADRVLGLMRIVNDDNRIPATTIDLSWDVRGLAITDDGRRIYVVAGGEEPEREGVFEIIDTQTNRIVGRMPLDALGQDGGKIVLTPDGFRAFVSVRGLWVREINLRRMEFGALVAVGEPGQERIADLRIVDGHVYALSSCERRRDTASLTSVVVANLRSVDQLRGLAGATGMGVGGNGNRAGHVLFLLDGLGGEVTVLDADTLKRHGSFKVPAGADALLLPPNEASDRGAVLYRNGFERPLARWFSADGVSDGPGLELPFDAWAPPVQGSAHAIDWMFVAQGQDLLAFRSNDTDTVRIPLAMAAAVLSIGR